MDEVGLFNCKIIVLGFHTLRASVKHTSTYSLGAHNDTLNLYLTYVAMLNGFCARRGINSTRSSTQKNSTKPWEKPKWLKRLKV